MSGLRTPLYETHIAAKAKMVDFAGFEMPIQYEGILAEHQATRTKATLFDVSHMGEILIKGKDSKAFINFMVTSDVSKMVPGQVIYTPMCYYNGGTVDDVLVYKLKENKFLMVTNAANTIKDFDYLTTHEGDFKVSIENVSEEYAQIALQGPKAVDILEKITTENVREIPYYGFIRKVFVADIKVIISRTGYTGEDGFELFCAPEEAEALWKALMVAGEPFGLMPAGLGCRDTLRFEAGMPLYGNELTFDINPFEAGLDRFVKMEKPDFLGKKALAHYLEGKQQNTMIGLELIDKGIARQGADICTLDRQVIGKVTTGYKSPTLDKSIAGGIVKSEAAIIGNEVFIHVRDKYIKAVMTSYRFYKHS